MYFAPSWNDKSVIARSGEITVSCSSLIHYDKSVRRRQGSFGFEASLSEMVDISGRITEFSKAYGQRAHENQRTGMVPQLMPTLKEMDDMIEHIATIHMLLQHLRDVVLNHHLASV